MLIVLNVLLVILAVDFFSGLLHWAEDSYGQPHWPITGKYITQPNQLHHKSPSEFTKNSWFESANVLLVIGGAVVGLAAVAGVLSWPLLLFAAIGVNANEIHKWTHVGRRHKARLVTALQSLGLLQTGKHHGRHHAGNKDSHYCLITNFMNPVLDRLKFWRGLEWVIEKTLGVNKRAEA
jgi:ubiquitin-conjugating enzyme E2 variant